MENIKMPTRKIQITAAWKFHDGCGETVDPRIFVLLNEIHESNKLTKAADKLGMSYRHIWNMLKKWTAFFGADLVELQKGKGAKLTPLGEKLLWAEQLVNARFEPQLISLASELNLEIQKNLSLIAPILKVSASHGYAVAMLPEFTNEFKLNLLYKNTEECLSALVKEECDIAALHLPTDIINPELISLYNEYLQGKNYKVISFVTRQQGLIIQKHNPKSIEGIVDLVKPDIKFINRQKGSGTRLLIEELLKREAINVKDVKGFGEVEFTHSAIAAYVASGMADAGIGVETAARQFGLDFIPLTTENYIMLCQAKSLNKFAVQQLISEIKSEKFHQAVLRLAGYKPDNCGEIFNLKDVLPW
jgi:molybdate transport repressor ModE-like protein